jgi:two-component system OmpR family sensor kinase
MKDKTLLLLSLAPAVLGALAAGLFSTGWVPDPEKTICVSGDIAGLALAAGILVSIVVGTLSLHASRRNRRWQQQVDIAHGKWSRERWDLLERLNHEAKHSLGAMKEDLSRLDPRALGPNEQQVLRSLAAHTRRLEQFLADMRKLAAIEATPIERAEVDVGTVVREAAALAEGSAAAPAARRVKVKVEDYPLPLPTVWGDDDLLLQAVYNVVNNAFKFSPPGSPVRVEVMRDSPAAIRIRVIDQGPGIPEDELHRVEEEFFRGKLARRVPGSGLGLAIVRAILRKHRGDMTIESELGAGTVVTILLPAGRPAPDAAR